MQGGQQACRICGQVAARVESRPCSRCGFASLAGPSAGFDYALAYDEKSSYNALSADAVLDHYRHAPNTAWALKHLEALKRAGASRLVEFGCSQGGFLALAQAQGYSVWGLELAPASVEAAERLFGLGAQVERGPWRPRKPEEPPADAACAFEVLEHSEDPLGFLSMLGSWLRPRGDVFLSVPNGERLAVRLGRREAQDFPPHHWSYWTTKSLVLAAQKVGWSPVDVRTSDLTHSDLLRLAWPRASAERAAALGSHRPVGERVATRAMSPWLSRLYPLGTSLGKRVALGLNRIPRLGGRLMLWAKT